MDSLSEKPRLTCFLLDEDSTGNDTLDPSWFDTQDVDATMLTISSERGALKRELARAAISGDASCILCVGGSGGCANPEATSILRGMADRMLPGFAEILRGLLFEAQGASAIFVELDAGLVGSRPVFVLPADAAVIRLAWERLIRPNLLGDSHPASSTPPAITELPAATPGPLVNEPTGWAEVEQIPVTVPAATGSPAPSGAGWQAALAALGGELNRSTWPAIPAELDQVPAARNVLETAGERAAVTLPDGASGMVCGFPDLLRPSSKVLLIQNAQPWPSVLALHRFPRKVGVLGAASSSYLSGEQDDEAVIKDRMGRLPPDGGQLFALDGGAVYLVREERIHRWDGRRQSEDGSIKQVLASLLLSWSSR